MFQNKFVYFLLEMHDKIIHNPKICLELRGHSVIHIRPRHYLSTPCMVQLTPGGRYRPLWEPLVYSNASTSLNIPLLVWLWPMCLSVKLH